MSLLALGLDHRTAPTVIREALAFEGPRLDHALDALRADHPHAEFVILSTCNRVELYAAAAEPSHLPATAALTAFLAHFHNQPAESLLPHLRDHHDEAAVAHLFRVAASLESLVLGEGQILGQVKSALQSARSRSAAGPLLHRVFEHALRVGKLVRDATGMGQGKLSIASVAVDVARDVFGTFADKTVLVIGAGKMGELTLQHLKSLHPGKILVTNRDPARAEAAAHRHGGEAVPFDRLNQALILADLVVSTTAADQPIVTFDQYARVQRARRNRLALILDIAVPRDFDPRIDAIEQVQLYNLDDLHAVTEQNRQSRRRSADLATSLLDQEVAACMAALRHQRHAGTLLRQLGDTADATRQRELQALFTRHPELDDAQRASIDHSYRRLQNQLLHHPRAALRTATATATPTDTPHPLLNAVRHLFGLPDPT